MKLAVKLGSLRFKPITNHHIINTFIDMRNFLYKINGGELLRRNNWGVFLIFSVFFCFFLFGAGPLPTNPQENSGSPWSGGEYDRLAPRQFLGGARLVEKTSRSNPPPIKPSKPKLILFMARGCAPLVSYAQQLHCCNSWPNPHSKINLRKDSRPNLSEPSDNQQNTRH